MNSPRRCPFDGGRIWPGPGTRMVCGECGLQYAASLIGDRARWRRFRPRAAVAAEQAITEHGSRKAAREMIGVRFAEIMQEVNREMSGG